MGRRKGSERREPVFDVTPGPAPAPSGDTRPAAAESPRRESGHRGKRRPGARRTGFGRIAYWGAVGSLVAGDRRNRRRDRGSAIYLPPIQSLEIPKRPPSIQIVDLNGRLLATRGEFYGDPVSLKELPRHVPQAFIAIEDRRFYSHYGVDPIGVSRALCRQPDAPRRGAGRLDHHPAARQEPVPDAGAHAHPQGAGARAGAVAGAEVQQDRDHRALSQSRLFRRRRLRHRGGGAALFQQAGAEAHRRGGRHARRPGAFAVAAGAEPQSGRRRAPRPDRARRDGGHEVRQRRHRQDRADAAGAGDEGRRRRLGAIRRRLGDGRAQRPGRPRRAGHRGRDHDRSGAAGRRPRRRWSTSWRRTATRPASARARSWR